ncbi:MAG: hypothetical protein HZA17_14745 [Nitrospirae bacterium]|nr:hypothetical protein [Nitrospirota bacterium]
MASKSKITITSKQIPEFSSNISVNNVTYHVQTEDMGTKTSKIFTRIYLKGEVVFSRQSDYCNILQMEDFREKLHTLMENQHKSAI